MGDCGELEDNFRGVPGTGFEGYTCLAFPDDNNIVHKIIVVALMICVSLPVKIAITRILMQTNRPAPWSHCWLRVIPLTAAFHKLNWHFNSPTAPTPMWERRLSRHSADLLVLVLHMLFDPFVSLLRGGGARAVRAAVATESAKKRSEAEKRELLKRQRTLNRRRSTARYYTEVLGETNPYELAEGGGPGHGQHPGLPATSPRKSVGGGERRLSVGRSMPRRMSTTLGAPSGGASPRDPAGGNAERPAQRLSTQKSTAAATTSPAAAAADAAGNASAAPSSQRPSPRKSSSRRPSVQNTLPTDHLAAGAFAAAPAAAAGDDAPTPRSGRHRRVSSDTLRVQLAEALLDEEALASGRKAVCHSADAGGEQALASAAAMGGATAAAKPAAPPPASASLAQAAALPLQRLSGRSAAGKPPLPVLTPRGGCAGPPGGGVPPSPRRPTVPRLDIARVAGGGEESGTDATPRSSVARPSPRQSLASAPRRASSGASAIPGAAERDVSAGAASARRPPDIVAIAAAAGGASPRTTPRSRRPSATSAQPVGGAAALESQQKPSPRMFVATGGGSPRASRSSPRRLSSTSCALAADSGGPSERQPARRLSTASAAQLAAATSYAGGRRQSTPRRVSVSSLGGGGDAEPQLARRLSVISRAGGANLGRSSSAVRGLPRGISAEDRREIERNFKKNIRFARNKDRIAALSVLIVYVIWALLAWCGTPPSSPADSPMLVPAVVPASWRAFLSLDGLSAHPGLRWSMARLLLHFSARRQPSNSPSCGDLVSLLM